MIALLVVGLVVGCVGASLLHDQRQRARRQLERRYDAQDAHRRLRREIDGHGGAT